MVKQHCHQPQSHYDSLLLNDLLLAVTHRFVSDVVLSEPGKLYNCDRIDAKFFCSPK
jgi:hypothetical protein